MTAKPAQARTAAQQSRDFYADPAMRIAAEMARQGKDWTQAGQTLAPHAVAGVRRSRQFVAASKGRPVQPLPTRQARKVARKVRRARQRTINGLAVMGVALLVLIFFLPLAAAATVALTLGAATVAYSH